ncbi:transmembrane protein [Mycobacterium bohemicum DSM 44277]|uniref:Transmembrane protein n=1 Tax=Mycobacterium bohemicum DSM 44277 TaxID=1236609 RepID=A0A0U0WF18_MYCBE|nr:transmembrane protein [Mycobacterium bohemicum DSM 44277]
MKLGHRRFIAVHRGLSVVVTSAVTPTKRTWSKAMLPGGFPVPLSLTGRVADWPFDR